MAHKTTIDGTVYEIKSGTALVYGTLYNLDHGKTLIDGTVCVLVLGGGLITFRIENLTYQAVEGMTWAEWCESEYNTAGYAINGNRVVASNGIMFVGNEKPSNAITNGAIYSEYMAL